MDAPVGLAPFYLVAGLFLSGGLRAESWVEPLSGMEFVRIQSGCFGMGRDERQAPSGSQTWSMIGFAGDIAADEKPKHEVCLDEFWIARHEATVGQWRQVMANQHGGDDGLPVTGLSWEQAKGLADELTRRSPSGRVFDLPTEAEWEYACRIELAASKDALANAEKRESEIGRLAWFAGNRRGGAGPSPVGGRLAGATGTHDLLGNVWEWVRDDYAVHAYARHPLYNPSVIDPAAGGKVLRGGSYRTAADRVGCTVRSMYAKDATLPQFGVRLVKRHGGSK